MRPAATAPAGNRFVGVVSIFHREWLTRGAPLGKCLDDPRFLGYDLGSSGVFRVADRAIRNYVGLMELWHNMKGWVFLLICLLFLMVICAMAAIALGTLTRPPRWYERKTYSEAVT